LRQNQFGFNVGGPLKREQTFFFFSYEGQRIRKAQTQTFSVPTAALRSGDFSGLAPLCDPREERRFSDAGSSADQNQRAGHNAAAQDAIKFVDARRYTGVVL